MAAFKYRRDRKGRFAPDPRPAPGSLGPLSHQAKSLAGPPALPEEQRAHLDRKMASAVASQPKFATLADRLMALGGAHVVATFEEDLDTLLGRGSVREGPVRFLKGRASHCHANAAALYEADPANRVVTGWALSEDGLWRQHSWCERARSLVETTERRVAYFGIELGDDEADEFCFNNL